EYLKIVVSGLSEQLTVKPHGLKERVYRTSLEGASILGNKALRCGERGVSATLSKWARGGRCPKARQLVFEPRLRCDVRQRRMCGNLRCDRVERLGKCLAGRLVLQHIRRGIEIDAVGKTSPQPSDIADLHQHVAGQFSLHGKIKAVAPAYLERRIERKGKKLAERAGRLHR